MLSPTRFTGLAFYHQKENSVSSNLKQKCTFVNLDSWVSVHINVCRSSPFFLLSTLLQRRAMDNRQDLEQRRKCVEQICTKRTGSSVSSGAAVFSCVWLHSCVQCPASTICILTLPSPPCFSVKSKSACTSAVNMSGKRICESGFKAHQAKHNKEQVEGENVDQALYLPPSLATVEKCSRPRREDRSFLCMYLC